MKIVRITGVALAALLFFCLTLSNAVAKDETRKLSAAVKSVKEIAATPKKGMPPDIIRNAYAVAIFPGAAKTDFMVSGKQAEGMLLVQDIEGKWSAPAFVSLSGGTLGWQVVAGPMDIILVFKSRKSIDSILKGRFIMDARQTVVIGPVGQSLKAATKEEQAAEILTYTRAGGSFADVVVAGATVQINTAANAEYYAVPKIRADDILTGTAGKASEEIINLQKSLFEYASRK
jgi:lipid-binding SYLF domain-containing protein